MIQEAVNVFEQKNETFKSASKELSSLERVSENAFTSLKVAKPSQGDNKGILIPNLF